MAVTVIALTLVLPILVAGSVNRATGQPSEPLILTMGTVDRITELNPFKTYTEAEELAMSLMYDSLVTYDEDMNPAPLIASAWEVDRWPEADDPFTPSVDEGAGRLWRYSIIQGATWHDGEPLTAYDVAYTINLNLYETMWRFTPIVNSFLVDHAVATGSYSVEVCLKKPNLHPESLTLLILPEHIWSFFTPGEILYSVTNSHPIGSGPFMFCELVIDEHLLLEKNPGYHKGPVSFDQLLLRFYTHESLIADDLRNGVIDAARFRSYGPYDGLKGSPEVFTAEVNSAYRSVLGFNCWDDPASRGNPLLRDEDIRRAMHLAVDKSSLVGVGWGGYGDVGYGLPSPVLPQYHWTPDTPEFSLDFNTSRANAILDACGYDKRDGNGIRLVNRTDNPYAPYGTPLAFEMLVRYDAVDDRACAPYLMDSWLAVGINVTVVFVDESTLTMMVYYSANFDLFMWYWSWHCEPTHVLSIHTEAQLWNWNDVYWVNQTYDALLDLQMRQTCPDRLQTIFEMQRMWYESSGEVVIAYPYGLYAWNTVRFSNWGSPESHPGRVIDHSYGASPLLLELGTFVNHPPAASFSVVPTSGTPTTVFSADASSCSDTEDPPSSLVVRWDWEDDGVWDTDWSSEKVASHSYPAAGTYTIRLEVKDAEGLTDNTMRQVDVRVDTQAPVTTISLEGVTGSAGWYISQVIVTLEATDDISGVAETWHRTLVEGSSVPAGWVEYTGAFVISAQGNLTVEYYSVDLEGNSEAAKSRSVKIDTLAPAVVCTIQGSSLAPGWYASTVTAQLAALESSSSLEGCSGVSAIYWKLDTGSWEAYDGPIVLEVEGSHTLGFYAADVAGNECAVGTQTVMVDRTPPTLTMLQEQGIVFDSSDVSIWWDSFDTVSGLNRTEVSVDASPFAPLDSFEHYYSSTNPVGTCLNLTELEDGEHYVVVMVRDDAGLVAEQRLNFTIGTIGGGVSGWPLWAVSAAAVAIVLLAISAVLLWRHRRGPDTPMPPGDSPGH